MKKLSRPLLIIIGFLLVPVMLFSLTFVDGTDYSWRTALETTGMVYGGAIVIWLAVVIGKRV